MTKLRLGYFSSETEPLRHLSYEQLARYVEHRLSESQRAFVDRHVRVCDMCLAELDDLDRFAAGANVAPEVVARRHRAEDLFTATVVEQVKSQVRANVPDFVRVCLDVDGIVEEEVVEQLIRLDVIQRSDLGEVLCEAVQQCVRVHVCELLLDLQPEAAAESLAKTVDIEQFRIRRSSGHS